VDVRDVAAVAVRTLLEPGHEGKEYTITGPEALGYGEIAACIAGVTGAGSVTSMSRRRPSGHPCWRAGARRGWPRAWTGSSRSSAREEPRKVTRVVEEVGRRTPATLERFVREFAATFGGR